VTGREQPRDGVPRRRPSEVSSDGVVRRRGRLARCRYVLLLVRDAPRCGRRGHPSWSDRDAQRTALLARWTRQVGGREPFPLSRVKLGSCGLFWDRAAIPTWPRPVRKSAELRGFRVPHAPRPLEVRISPSVNSATETGLPAGCCDAILLRGVYHHLTEPTAALVSLRRALRPGGRLLVIDFAPVWWLAPWTPKGIPKDRGGMATGPRP